ncbi:MAG TPA: hypothetical protein VHZ95_09815 [Polyangiales bacterium]|nr:hypothetical protein [Polyangiales bacterium]
MTNARATSLRRELTHHERGRGNRYPVALRDRVVGYAEARRAEGASWVVIASELGLQIETVRRWCLRDQTAEPVAAMIPVEIIDAPRATLSIVSPSGVRVEGATLAEVIAVLRALR